MHLKVACRGGYSALLPREWLTMFVLSVGVRGGGGTRFLNHFQ